MSKFTTPETLDAWFGYHPPKSDAVREAHEEVRSECRALAEVFSNLLPEGPDKTTALNKVREAMYAANACIAVAQRVYEPATEAPTEAYR